MKVIHMMKREKFTKGVCDFYDQYFNNGEHELCFLNLDGGPSLLRADLTLPQQEICFSGNRRKALRQLCRVSEAYDYVVFHSFLFDNWIKSCLALQPGLRKKIIWIEWGGDLYSWRSKSGGIKGKLLDRMNRTLREHCRAVVCIFPPDQDIYHKEFPGSKAKVFYAPYSSGTISPEYQNYTRDSRLRTSRDGGEPIYIQVGHSATPMIDHIRTLNDLKRFAHRDIRIFLPLNYGDRSYADQVQRHAEELFPGKVICLRDMLPPEEYFALLARVDIGVFHTFRQIALGNIQRMLFRNVKLYMPEESVMYRYFAANGVPVQKSEDLAQVDFDSLISDVRITDEARFRQLIDTYSNMECRIGLWKAIYDNLRDDLKKIRGSIA